MTEKKQEGMAIGFITEEALAAARSRIGLDLRRFRYVTRATDDAIRHYCHGIGDENPLYLDPSYASRSRYGGLIAPPGFLHSVHWPGGGGMGFPGVHGFHSGNDWDWYKTVHVNDVITVKEHLTDVVEKKGQFGGRMVIMYAEAQYRNQRDELISKALGWTFRVERRASREKGKYAGIERAKYSAEELKAIENDYIREEIRGASPRYWEDVNIGDEMTPVVKGPLNMTDMFAFVAGTLGGGALGRGGAHGIGVKYRLRHPSWSYTDPETGVTDIPEMVHSEDSMAQEIGIPGAYDYGCQRVCWMLQLGNNWQGDDGFLKNIYIELRRFNVLGDTTWMKGKVAKKYIENGEHIVVCETYGENQRKEVTAPGRLTIALPSRSVTPVGSK